MHPYRALAVFVPIMFMAQSCLFPSFGGQNTAGGVVKSVDAGETWNAAAGGTAGGLTSAVMQLVIDPAHPQVLYAASPASGLYRSSDGAAGWTAVLAGAQVYSVAVNPQNSEEIIAGGAAGRVGKVFRSSDSGQTWIEIYTESKQNVFVTAVVYHPQFPAVIFAGLSTGEILISQNSGLSWNVASLLDSRIVKLAFSSPSAESLYALTTIKGLHRGDGAGKGFQALSDKLNAGIAQDFAPVHTDRSSVYLGTAGGLFRTISGGASWDKLSLPLHEETTVASAVAVNQSNPNEVYVIVGLTFYKSTDAGRTWQTRSLGVGSVGRSIVIDPTEQNIIYSAFGLALN